MSEWSSPPGFKPPAFTYTTVSAAGNIITPASIGLTGKQTFRIWHMHFRGFDLPINTAKLFDIGITDTVLGGWYLAATGAGMCFANMHFPNGFVLPFASGLALTSTGATNQTASVAWDIVNV